MLLIAACAIPKAVPQAIVVIEEPLKKTSTPKVAAAPVLPVSDEADQLRLPGGMLEKLPDRAEFQPTNPSVVSGKTEGAPVIAHPPSNQSPGTR